MKKFLVMMLLSVAFVCSAFGQVQYYKTTSYASATIYNGRYVWSNWQSSDMTMTINLTTDVITIYSPVRQVYNVYAIANNGKLYNDNDGGQNIKFYVVDQDDDRGEVRLRVESNGNSQVYVDFSNIAWCYNVYRYK